jgi:hypothetical protein
MERLFVCHASRINQTASLDFGRRSPTTNLPHEGQQVGDPPVIGNLSVPYAHHIDGLKLDFAVGRSNSKIWALVGSVIRFKGGHAVAVGKLPVDLSVKVWNRLAQVRVELAHAGLVWSCSGLRCVIDKIICEELVEDFELPLALNFLCVSAHD